MANAVLGNAPFSPPRFSALASYISFAQQVLSTFNGNINAPNLTVLAEPDNSTTAGTPLSLTDLSSLSTLLYSFGALGGFVRILVFGGVLETLRRLVLAARDKLAASIWITARFEEYDHSFDWMMLWLSKQPSWVEARDLEISTKTFGLDASAILVPGEEDDQNLSSVSSRSLAYLPASSVTCSLWYRRRYMSIKRVKTKTGRRHSLEENLYVSILTRHHHVLNELLRAAKKEYMAASQHMIAVHISDSSNNWMQVASRPKRDIKSIILDPGVAELLVGDARDFLSSKPWYAARGIPFRRGYLLYGAPGSGKTSIISSIAGELGLDIYIISLSRTALDDVALSELISNLPEKCIALMEDIDAAFTHGLNRDVTDEAADTPGAGAAAAPSSRVSLSGLLNALDGVAAQEGRILYATTNKYSALDPALCRPGRMDIHVEFRLASKDQARRLFTGFFLPDEEEAAAADDDDAQAADADMDAARVAAPADAKPPPEKPLFFGTSHRHRAPKLRRKQVTELAARFADAIPEREVSMAALQGFLMTYKIRPGEAVGAARGWVESERAARETQWGRGGGR
ncbi:P-loop containing nucleoside triphosphate hydrolase protein [Mycena belliarum]|uniref:P-loop containing nucleoside triphosphate hydrolase protein n=1 Tax=Mycena belliarum TaxID=1033014 RepID=A0AAD6UD99_9AGAR|nr:P-loop containing nucleoside triphosphate hydrolase protein [Mycena belliae]